MPQSTLDLILRTKKEGAGEKDAQKGLSDLMSTATKTVGVLTGAAVLMKKAFEFGEAGATILQTRDSFDLLLEKVGAAPDLLDQLQVASRGTVDDLTLMSATIGLVAGAQGELATAMAGSAPELLEIAKAAQKLKPELGDVAFIYESLATGVKRASPLMIDNAGITVKIGEANEKLAALLGKSVEQLTAEEQKMALLTATLEGGRVLIDQVGGSTESATDSFARLESNTKNLSDALKAKLAPSLATAAEAASVLMMANAEINKALEKGNTVILESTDSYDEYGKAVMETLVATWQMHEYQQKVGLHRLAEGNDLDTLIPAWGYYTEAQYNAIKSSAGLIDETSRLKASQDRLNKDLTATASGIEETKKSYFALKGATISTADGLDDLDESQKRVISSQVDLAWEQRNAQVAAENLAVAQAALDRQYQDLQLTVSGPIRNEMESFGEQQDTLAGKAEELRAKIDELEGQSYLTSAQKEQLDGLQTDLGEVTDAITANEVEHTRATKQILFNLLSQRALLDGLTSDELTLLNDIALGWDLVDQATYDATIAMDSSLTALAEGESLETVKTKLIDTLEAMVSLEGDHYMTLDLSVTGDPMPILPSGPRSGGLSGGGTTHDYGAGGAFWVDEPTRITVGEGGEDEFVTVTPRSKMGPEQMNQTNIYLNATYPPTTPASIDQDIRTLMFYYQTRSH